MLRMEVQAAWQLKRPLEAMAAISEKSMMVVSPDWLLLTAINEDDLLPAVLRLPPHWFLRYELTGLDRPNEHYYAMNLDLSTFRANLLAAHDLDLVTLRASPQSWDALYLTFESQDGRIRTLRMEISLAENPNLEPWISMNISPHHRIRIGVNSDDFTHILQHSIQSEEPVCLIVTSRDITMRLYSGLEEIVRTEDRGFSILSYIPGHTECRVFMALNRTRYLLSACQMGGTIYFGFGNPEPLMLIPWCRDGLLTVSMPFQSSVEPLVLIYEADE